MIEESEKVEIINKAIEKMLLILPETIGTLLASQVALHRLNTDFYAKYPEFKNQRNIVTAVIEMVEGRNPLESYEKILENSVLEIRERIKVTKGLDMQNVSKTPNRDFSSLEIDKSGFKNNGMI